MAVSPVQTAITRSTTSTTQTVTLTTPVYPGHLLTLAGNETSAILISGVTGGGTWTKASSIALSTTGSVEQWYCLSATGGATGDRLGPTTSWWTTAAGRTAATALAGDDHSNGSGGATATAPTGRTI